VSSTASPRSDCIVEIASVEHPRLLAALLEEAQARTVPIGRISQGGGTRALTDDELRTMLDLAHAAGVEVFTYISARNSFEPLADPSGGDQLRGEAAFADALAELERCVAFGVDGVLIADIGLLAVAGRRRREGALGPLKLKTAAAIAPRNAASAALYAELGATSINTAASSTLDDLAAMRAAIGNAVSIDVYVESPDDFGGGLRYREVPELVRRLAPISLKFGLRNAPSLYPYGRHLEPTAEATIREKVRRAQIALGRLAEASLAGEVAGG
jgi:Peptidase family U32